MTNQGKMSAKQNRRVRDKNDRTLENVCKAESGERDKNDRILESRQDLLCEKNTEKLINERQLNI